MFRTKVILLSLTVALSLSGLALFRHSGYQNGYQPRLTLLSPDGKNYPELWAKVDSLDKKGLPKSALEEVKKIYALAQTDKNGPQIIKSMIFLMKYNSVLEEDDFVIALNDLNKMAAESAVPQKQMIHSIIAEVYWGFYQNNRWKFMNRTQTVDFKNEDIRTWDLNKLSVTILQHYLLSLTEDEKTKTIDIASYKDILWNYASTDRELRPTVYDFLAHRALDFLKSTEFDVTRPAYTFRLDKPEYFSTSEIFTTLEVNNKDSLASKYYATKIFQLLEKFHATDKDPSAMITLQLERLNFVRSYSTLQNKDTLYYAALKNMLIKYKDFPASSEISYHIALVHNQLGELYNPLESDEHKNERLYAIKVCDEAISKFPKAYGSDECQRLKSQINEKSFSITMEEVVPVNHASKMLLTSRNVNKVYIRIIQPGWDFEDRNSYNSTEDYIKKLLNMTPVRQWEYDLKDDGDKNSHAIEMEIPALGAGYYIILAGSDKNFSMTNNAVWWNGFGVSNISYTERRNWQDESIEISVMDRNNGSPLPGIKAQLYYKEYNYRTGKYNMKKAEAYTTNALGQFTIPPTGKDYRYIFIDFQGANDRLNSDQSFYQYKRYRNDDKRTVTYFFTDRSIYRPGQTIYFKGIRITTDANGEHPALQTNQKAAVVFYDNNYQKIADVNLTTNDYGSFSGSFTAPSGVLNGQMRISDGYGTRYFSVEEYKRPKFEATFDKVQGVYKFGQTINIKGNAKAYAGSAIDGAKVAYHVTRNVYFPYYWYSYNWYYGPGRYYSGNMEINFGETVTDEAGNFNIAFQAVADDAVNKKYHPAFSYTIVADITDINGETHSTSTTVNVGEMAMILSVPVPGELVKSNKEKFAISAANLNGTPVNAKGKITVHKLKQPDQIFVERKWQEADRKMMSREEYYKTFPGELYANENDKTKWEKEKEVFSFNFDTQKNDSLYLKNISSWQTGDYILEAVSIDSFGVEVKEVRYFTLLDEKSKSFDLNIPFKVKEIKTNCEPGDNASFLISSAYPDAKVLVEIEEKSKIVSAKWYDFNKSQTLVEIPVEEKHRGNFVVHLLMVHSNRIYHQEIYIYVPHSDKELDLEFETFRNKILPGSAEEWKMKIKGPKGEKVASELLLTMYDASLDVFAPNSFYFWPHPGFSSSRYWSNGFGFNNRNSTIYQRDWNTYYYGTSRYFDRLEWFGYQPSYYRYSYYGGYDGDLEDVTVMSEISASKKDRFAGARSEVALEEAENEKDYKAVDEVTGTTAAGNVALPASADKNAETGAGEAQQHLTRETAGKDDNHNDIKARTNLNETAFFFPQLETNENGDVVIKFTAPESLTRWKVIGLAHSKDLKVGTVQKEVITQKELMILPNAPRFFREGDKIVFAAKISNMSDKDLQGNAQLHLFESTTMKAVDADFNNKTVQVDFTAKKGQSALVKWELIVPEGMGSVTYRITAKANGFSDGEEMALPVLTNRMLVTESLPLPIRKAGTRTYKLEKLVHSGHSKTLRNHKLTLEFTNNPAWYAIQAMPYMMEYPYECAEQVFTRFYANSIATHIMNSSPKIKAVFDSWKNSSPEAFMSNLEKNQELKSLLLEETPWVLDAQNESERKKRVALLFDLNRMSNELSRALNKLQKMQVSNGAWPWFPGMPESRYITQHVVTGMGHLDKLGVKNIREDRTTWNMIKDAIGYLDRQVVKDYQYIKTHYENYKNEQHLSYDVIQFIYARSYFSDVDMGNGLKEALSYYQDQSKKYWLNFGLYAQGMLSLGANRFGQKDLANDIVKSIREKAIHHEELGMYWKDNVVGYYWYQAPIETHALLMEMFDEVVDDQNSVEELKVWLLKNKQTSDWKTTKATADACYALLLRGTKVLDNDEMVEIRLGGQIIDPKKLDTKVEAGTGYFKTSWSGEEIKPQMGEVTLTKKTDGVAWGALYWQYFEQLDKITPHDTPLKLSKKLFLVQHSASGDVMSPVTEDTRLAPGDKVRVRVELRVDREMQYVHMKDMRASCFEPVTVFSSYRWQDGLGYYQSTKDAATNFFFEYLPKGTHVFEYDLTVAQLGDFSNGITTIQCMYAPEFTSHSEGIRVNVKGK